MNIKLLALLFLIIYPTVTFAQKSATIKVQRFPGMTLVDGQSEFVLPEYMRLETTKNCLSFLDVAISVKASGNKDNPYRFKVEVSNNSRFEVFVNCSSWGFGSGGGNFIKSGRAYSSTKDSSEEYLSVTITAEFYFTKEDSQRYGVSHSSGKLSCNETPDSYLAKIKTKTQKEEVVNTNSASTITTDNNNNKEEEEVPTINTTDNIKEEKVAAINNHQVTESEPEKKKSIREQHEEHVRENNERAASYQEEQKKQREQAEQEKQRQLAEQKRRREAEERRRKEKIKAYNDRIESQQKKNNAMAASAAASSAGLLYLLGGVIYDNMGTPADDLYAGNNFFANMDFGYGFSHFPMVFNSKESAITYSGDTRTVEETRESIALTINLRLAFRMGYETENVGGNIFGRLEPGFSPIFTEFNLSTGYGLELFGGLEKFKLYGRYEVGEHNFSMNDWMNAEDLGGKGKTSTKHKQIRGGFKFSYYRDSRTAKRDHITIGVMENYFDRNSASIFGLREDYEKPFFNLVSTPYDSKENNPFIATGYFFEWKRDHTHKLYIEYFPNYPVTGEVGKGRFNEGKVFLQVGFVRCIDGFY